MNPRIPTLLYYVGALSISMSLIGYGLSWKEWVPTIGAQHIFTEGGRQAEGKVTSLSGFGFGRYKDFSIRIEGAKEDFRIPATLLNDFFGTNSETPTFYLGEVLSEGDEVKASTTGGTVPVVMSLAKKENGAYREILNANQLMPRFSATIQHSTEIADRFVNLGLLTLPFAMFLHFLFFLRRRKQAKARAA